MKNFFKKLWAAMTDERNEKAILILLPCIAVLVCVLILAPQIMALARGNSNRRADVVIPTPSSISSSEVSAEPSLTEQTGTQASPAVSPVIPSPAASPVTTPAATPTASSSSTNQIKTQLKASSVEKDLYITVCGSDGKAISGQTLTLSVTYPDGQTYNFNTDTQGDCYLVKLTGGEYTVAMRAQKGYASAAAIKCTVNEQVEHVQIENIEAIVTVKDVSEVPQEEVTPSSPEAPSPGTAQIITTPDGIYGEGNVLTQETPVLDANGNQTYTYTYNVGPNGYLLYRGTQQESNIIPVDENGDGKLDYGQYFLVPTTPAQGSESELSAGGYYVSVELFGKDNRPVEDYDITATPIMHSHSTPVGWHKVDGKMYYYDSNGNKVTGLKKIDGKIYYFDQSGVRASSVGIDVSFYNDDINWQAIKAEGIDFAIIRLGGRTWRDGELYGDSYTQEYLKEAKNAGIKIGAYFYSTAINSVEAVQEASVALNTLNGISLDMPLFIDMEYSGIYPQGRADNLSTAQRHEVINAFCETVENSGYAAGVYSGENFMKSNLNYSQISQYTVWLASYTSNNRLPNFTQRYDIWQFTDRGALAGVKGNVDLNVIF